MNKIVKNSLCVAMTAVMMTGTFMVAGAARKYTRNNTGNSCPYKSSIDISLGTYTVKGGAPEVNLGDVQSDHYIYYSKPTAKILPWNNKTYWNQVWWYAEWKKDSGRGKIIDSIEEWSNVGRNDTYERDLSDGMKLRTWDSDITYFSFKVAPEPAKNIKNGKKGKEKYVFKNTVDKAKFYDYRKYYVRRASTDITH